jgi:hypothetical protein
LGGNRRHRGHSRIGAAAAGAVAVALALSVTACGGGSASNSGESSATYPVEVVTARFPTEQRLGQTALLRLGVRNTGQRTLPALTVTISVGGEEGGDSSLPFGYRDPQPGLALPDRPVWVLAARYPKANGSSESAGAETANPKTFDYGPLKAGATTEALWKVSAVKAGRFRLLYRIGAGLGGTAKADSAMATEAGGSFGVRVSTEPPQTVVTDSGEVVPAPKNPTQANR